MVNRRQSRDSEEMVDATNGTGARGRAQTRKESKTSDHSDNKRDNNTSNSINKKNGSRNVDSGDNLRKRDAIDTKNRRKRSESSDSSDESQDKRKSKNQGGKAKNGRFDSSDSESNRKDSIEDSDNDSVSDKRKQSSDKRTKSNTDNTEYEVYFGEISFDAREEDIRKHFSNCGNITQIKLLTRDDGKSRGRGFIKFSDEKSMKNALKLNNTEMMGRKVVVEVPANASNKRPNQQNGGEESSSVIVRNLPFNLQEEEFGGIFEDCGSIKKYRIIKNESGESKGFGFVDFESPADAKNALSKSGLEIKGRNITVDFSIPKDNRGSFGGNRGSFGGNRGSFGGNRGSFGGNRGFGGRGGRRDFGNDRPSRGYRRND